MIQFTAETKTFFVAFNPSNPSTAHFGTLETGQTVSTGQPELLTYGEVVPYILKSLEYPGSNVQEVILELNLEELSEDLLVALSAHAGLPHGSGEEALKSLQDMNDSPL
jgi:hypothetical protein